MKSVKNFLIKPNFPNKPLEENMSLNIMEIKKLCCDGSLPLCRYGANIVYY